MADRFVPLTPRTGARGLLDREEILRPAFADECMDALEQYGVLVFPQIGLTDAEHLALSRNLGKIIPMGPMRPDGTQEPMFKVSIDPQVNPAAEYILITFGWHMDGLVEEPPPARRP
jgi:alpha-ketoglutarate-dependent taurine dioxygenase